jgi:hypothetical protein
VRRAKGWQNPETTIELGCLLPEPDDVLLVDAAAQQQDEPLGDLGVATDDSGLLSSLHQEAVTPPA